MAIVLRTRHLLRLLEGTVRSGYFSSLGIPNTTSHARLRLGPVFIVLSERSAMILEASRLQNCLASNTEGASEQRQCTATHVGDYF